MRSSPEIWSEIASVNFGNALLIADGRIAPAEPDIRES